MRTRLLKFTAAACVACTSHTSRPAAANDTFSPRPAVAVQEVDPSAALAGELLDDPAITPEEEYRLFRLLTRELPTAGREGDAAAVVRARDVREVSGRPDVRPGHFVPFCITKGPQRVGTMRFGDMSRVTPVIHLDAQPLRVALVKSSFSSTKDAYEGAVELPPESVMRLADGDHQLGATINWNYEGPRDKGPRTPQDVILQVRLAQTIRLTSGAKSKVALEFSTEQAGAVEAAITATATADPNAAVLRITLASAGAPIDLAFSGRLEAGGLQRDLGQLTFDAHKPGTVTITLADVLPAWDPETVNLTLSPSVDAAENTLAMSRIWGGQVSLFQVKVTRGAPAKKKG